MIRGEKYHLFNHANGKENLFVEQKNYPFFLQRLAQHILPVCKLYSYCLMPNHFHLVLQVHFKEELQKLWQKNEQFPALSPKQLELKISKAFSNFFSSYTQSEVYNRMGSMFIPSMKTELIEDNSSFCKRVHCTHTNPVHHGFTKRMEDWPHSSYKIFFSKSPTKLEREYVLESFGGLDAFIKYHQQPIDLKSKFLE